MSPFALTSAASLARGRHDAIAILLVLAFSLCFAGYMPGQGAPAGNEVNLLSHDGLSDWVQEFHPWHRERAAKENMQAFSLRGGVLHVDGSVGNVGFLRYRRQFCDFELKAEFRAAAGTNNGFCFRAPVYEKETPAHTGYELQILVRDNVEPISATGALYSVAPPLATVSLKPNTWHRARIVARGAHIQAWIDDVLVQDFRQDTSDATRNRPGCGYISVQNHGGDTDFRNMRVAVLE